MDIVGLIILFSSIGFILMGFIALYMSTKENKTIKEKREYLKINGVLNLIMGFIGTSIAIIDIFSDINNKIFVIIFITLIFLLTLLQLFISKKI